MKKICLLIILIIFTNTDGDTNNRDLFSYLYREPLSVGVDYNTANEGENKGMGNPLSEFKRRMGKLE